MIIVFFLTEKYIFQNENDIFFLEQGTFSHSHMAGSSLDETGSSGLQLVRATSLSLFINIF